MDNWSTYQLTEFLGAVASLRAADDVAGHGIQRIAEAVDAEVGAYVGPAGVVCSLGFPFGVAPEATIEDAIRAGSGPLELPGIGRGDSLVVPIEDEDFTSLLLVRLGDEPFTRDEINLAAGMVRVLELVLGNLRAFAAERASRTSLQERQALLEKLARIERSISLRAPLVDVLDAITQGARELLGDEVVGLRLVDAANPDGLVLVASRGLTPEQERAMRHTPAKTSAGGRAFLEQRLVIVDDYEDNEIGVAELRAEHLQTAMAVPVREDGKVVGSLTVATYRARRTYSASEQEMLEALAEHASLALTDARMIEAMRTAEQEKDAMLADVLAGAAERERLESQLRQVQKMEAVGQLAGGIAHDFNNLLMVILNYAELVAGSFREDDPRRRPALEITAAAERAAALTRQLLAFSRKEVVRPEIVDLNEAVPDLVQLLRRTLRESIEVELELAPDLWGAKIDRSQLEQVIMNLAVNASDAMAAGGTLRVQTANRVEEAVSPGYPGLEAGEYVVLSVADTGSGMEPEVAARAFEPFFTTKPRGSGTGLGLATVYGIVKQAGGYVSLSSEPGCGTTARVFLPATTEVADRPAAVPASPRPGVRDETILVVEDEDSVRGLVSALLEKNGYRVLAASCGSDALELAAAHAGEIALALTDVVMPGMSGREFADRFLELEPEARIVFMSGYPDTVASELGVLGHGVHYLQKPFGETAVLEVLDGALDAGARAFARG